MFRKFISAATCASALLFVTIDPEAVLAQDNDDSVRNIVLVHGAWADGSSWSKVIAILSERRFNVVAVQNPLTSLQDDVAITRQAIERLQKTNPGPVLLVGHSYGGAVITEAGSIPEVTGLVYVAAFAPKEGESTESLSRQFPAALAAPGLSQQDDYGFITLTREGIFSDFAQDVSEREKEVLLATQGPTAGGAALGALITTPAWRTKLSWFVVAANDRAISPELEQMEAKRMKAVTITVPTSHVAMIAEPRIVADFITLAARSLGRK